MKKTTQEIEGHFNGQIMVADNGDLYPVPANYASKSKLVDGDSLILKIQSDGTFIYKQARLVHRKRVIAEIVKDKEDGRLKAKIGKKEYKILVASASFYKLKEGDKATIILPSEKETDWAVIEYLIN